MPRRHIRRKAKKPRPAAPPAGDSSYVRPLDSEDQTGTYAPPHSDGDTGESDDGVLVEGPPSSSPPKQASAPRKEASDETQEEKRRPTA